MKFFDKMYVGFSRQRYTNAEEPRVLGFAVPYGTTAAEKKRIETVDGWRDKTIDVRVMDNAPTRGFKLIEVVSRYSTSDKLFRVQDPRGLELEISAENLLNIVLSSTIVNGEIIDECVWASDRVMHLVLTKDEVYLHHLKSSTSVPTKQIAVNYYVADNNITSVFRFEGTFHHTWLEYGFVGTEGSHVPTPGANRWTNKCPDVTVSAYDANVTIKMNSGKKPIYVYTEFRVDEDNHVNSIMTIARKTKLKKLVPWEETPDELITRYEFDPMHWTKSLNDYYFPVEKKDLGPDYEGVHVSNSVDAQVVLTGIGFHASKELAQKYDYTAMIEDKLKAETLGHYSHSVDTNQIWKAPNDSYHYNRVIKMITLNAKRTINVLDKRLS